MTAAGVQRWRGLLLFAGGGLLLALLVAALMVWWRGTHERIERRIPLPPQGEAAYNPLYLLREALRADGVDVRTRRRLQLDADPPGERDTLLIYSDPGLLGSSEVDQLLDWVERGGHLIIRASHLGPKHARRDLMIELNIWPRSDSVPDCPREWQADPDDLRQVFCHDQRFTLTDEPPMLAFGNPSDGYAFARLARGSGTVDVFSSLDFLDNQRLATSPRAALTRQVLAPNYSCGTVHLVYVAQMPPLWQLLLEHGPMAWIPLLLALAAWLWLRMPRFGPLHPAPVPARRALLEHVAASGEHLYRYGRIDVLHAALRAAFLARLAQRDPQAAALRGQAQHAAIAAHTGLTVDALADALTPPTSRTGFLARATYLQQMRHRL